MELDNLIKCLPKEEKEILKKKTIVKGQRRETLNLHPNFLNLIKKSKDKVEAHRALQNLETDLLNKFDKNFTVKLKEYVNRKSNVVVSHPLKRPSTMAGGAFQQLALRSQKTDSIVQGSRPNLS